MQNLINFISAIGWGDPHYTTFDGVSYDFNDRGEYVLLEVLPKNASDDSEMMPVLQPTNAAGDPVFTLDGRMEPSMWPATTHHGLAFGRPDLAFHV